MSFLTQILNDAISRPDEAEKNFTRADLYILPHCSTLSAEDSDDEDERKSLNHLSEKQLAAPAEVVMHTSGDATTSSAAENEGNRSKTTKRTGKEVNTKKSKWVAKDNSSNIPKDNPKHQHTS